MAKPKGKYAHITPHLKRFIGPSDTDSSGDPNYQARINAAKQAALVPPSKDEAHGRENLAIVKSATQVLDQQMKLNIELILRACAGQRHGIELAHTYAAARDLQDVIKNWHSTVHLLVEAYGQLLVEQGEIEGTSGMDIAGRSVGWFDEPYTKTVSKDDVRTFFMADPDLVASLQPMWNTVDALNRKRLLAGEEPIPGTEVFSKPKIRLGSE